MGNSDGLKREDTVDFIEREVWSPSYLNLSYSIFSKFCNQSCSTSTRSQATGIIYWTPAIVRHLCDQSKTRVFTFWLRSPLRSRSRVDLGKFFGQAGLHWLGPTFILSVSIRHDLYFIYKAASVRSDLL